jgi:hypothetical protein
MRTTLLLAALLVSAVATPAKAAEAIRTAIGDTNVAIPMPRGFNDAQSKARPFFDFYLKVAPAPPLAVFISAADTKRLRLGLEPRLGRYFLVASSVQFKGRSVTQSEFLEIRAYMRSQFQAVTDQVRPDVQSLLDSTAEKVNQADPGVSVAIRGGEDKVLEVFDERDTSIGILSVGMLTATVAGVPHETPMASGCTVALVKGKLVYFYAYSEYRSSSDLEWVRAQSKQWVSRLTRAN